MDVHGNNESRDVFGNEQHNAFGGPHDANVYGNPPADVWGNHLAGDSSTEPQDQHHGHSGLFGGLWDYFFGSGHHD